MAKRNIFMLLWPARIKFDSLFISLSALYWAPEEIATCEVLTMDKQAKTLIWVFYSNTLNFKLNPNRFYSFSTFAFISSTKATLLATPVKSSFQEFIEARCQSVHLLPCCKSTIKMLCLLLKKAWDIQGSWFCGWMRRPEDVVRTRIRRIKWNYAYKVRSMVLWLVYGNPDSLLNVHQAHWAGSQVRRALVFVWWLSCTVALCESLHLSFWCDIYCFMPYDLCSKDLVLDSEKD